MTAFPTNPAPVVKSRVGGESYPLSPEDYQKLLESDYKKWAEVAKKAKIEGQ